jgi:hypothetical protein
MKYKYVLEQDYTYQSDIIGKRFTGVDGGRIWLEIYENGTIVVSKGYAWDGTTLSPDFKSTYYASLLHDALYQFLNRGNPLSRKEIDCIFRDIMKRDGFKLAGLYYGAVRAFGGIFVKLTH